MKSLAALFLVFLVLPASPGKEYHVSIHGSDAGDGSPARMLRTISAAARLAEPGDVVTVHEGVYRERVAPARGGESDAKRIVYRAAPGERVEIKGSEVVRGWERVGGDTWKATIPNTFFGPSNPYAEFIRGDWFDPRGRRHHPGSVYLDGHWLAEAPSMDEVLQPAGTTPVWYAEVDGAPSGEYLVNIAWLKIGDGERIPAAQTTSKKGTCPVPCSEGGECVGHIRPGDWLRYDGVDFGAASQGVELRVASPVDASEIEIRLDGANGPLLGTAAVPPTGDWQKWISVRAGIGNVSGRKNLCLIFKTPRVENGNTTISAQFPGVDPNRSDVEINVRDTVFTPSGPGVDYITVRGFILRNAATNWAPPSAAQFGLVSAYWCKGWIIEDNDIAYSRCCGVALGKNGDKFDNTNSAGAADPYTECVRRALKNGWNKATVGSHIVRNNHIHHCGQTGIVGSLGCSFSTIAGNEIHDIHLDQPFGGAEMAGIKLHGAIDVDIRGNHVYRCGDVSGIWLDWMAQGARVEGNLLHDNTGGCGDIFLEMQHGPLLVANNLLLSKRASFCFNSKGIAVVHNLIVGPISNTRFDDRNTPFHPAHSTEFSGLRDAPGGDHRFYNNLIVAPCNLHAIDNSILPCAAAGNVFTGGAQPSKFDTDALVRSDFDPEVHLTRKPDGWYLAIIADAAWRDRVSRKLVTTDLLGKPKVPNVPYENTDGSPLRVTTDYFGGQRNEENPFPGPLELPEGGRHVLKVWPIEGP